MAQKSRQEEAREDAVQWSEGRGRRQIRSFPVPTPSIYIRISHMMPLAKVPVRPFHSAAKSRAEDRRRLSGPPQSFCRDASVVAFRFLLEMTLSGHHSLVLGLQACGSTRRLYDKGTVNP